MHAVHEVNQAAEERLDGQAPRAVRRQPRRQDRGRLGAGFQARHRRHPRGTRRWCSIEQLLDDGADVRVFDPEALENVKRLFGDQLTYCDRAYGTTEGADALAIVTEWQEFRNPDFEVLRRLMNRPVIVDGRNLYDPAQMADLGFTYASVGRQTVTPPAEA